MKNVKRSWNLIPDEKRNASIQEIIDFFEEERDEKIGIIAAESILDFFLQAIGMDLYNKGVEDSRNFMKSRFDDLELDMEALLKK